MPLGAPELEGRGQLAILSRGVSIEEGGQEPWGDLGKALQAEGAAVQRAESKRGREGGMDSWNNREAGGAGGKTESPEER